MIESVGNPAVDKSAPYYLSMSLKCPKILAVLVVVVCNFIYKKYRGLGVYCNTYESSI